MRNQDNIQIVLKDGKEINVLSNSVWLDVAGGISPKLARSVLIAKVDGKLTDLNSTVSNGRVEFFTFDDEEGKTVYRHTTAHILAQAVKRLYPEVKLAIGPTIEDGYYYDFDLEKPFTPQDLEAIEEEMRKIIKEDLKIVREELVYEEALRTFGELGEHYKVELVEGLSAGEKISIYRQGEFVDLCLGPHLLRTGLVGAVKLLHVAGAYWKGDEHNRMLQRIYGTSFPKKQALEDHLKRLEEAKLRDHRKLGKELELFGVSEEGPGFPFFYPKGMIVRLELEKFWREIHYKQGYQEIKTPLILNRSLWEKSGHWDLYKENMYFLKIDEDDYAVKPMNCPGAMLYYKTQTHSYRDLPLKIGELGLVHRHERSGVLHGLLRVRCFTQDDAHIFMLPEQVTAEILGVINLIDYFYRTFGFTYKVELSTKPDKALGSPEIWEKATLALIQALEERGLDYKVNEGDGAFYGPKIDFHLLDSLGRSWQCGTIQVDFVNPENFDLSYVGEDGNKHRPVMIHRVIFGSIERFLGILVEHYAGAFPVWLAPVQVKIILVASRNVEYGRKVSDFLKEEGIRVELDDRNERVGYKIREAEMGKVPYILVIGDKEEEFHCVRVRARHQGDQGNQKIGEFMQQLKLEIQKKQ